MARKTKHEQNKEKAAKQKKIAIGGGVLLVALLAIQVPRTMKMMNGDAKPPVVSSAAAAAPPPAAAARRRADRPDLARGADARGRADHDDHGSRHEQPRRIRAAQGRSRPARELPAVRVEGCVRRAGS